MAKLTKVPDGKRYVCDLVAFEPGTKIPTAWRGKGQLIDIAATATQEDAMTWKQRQARQALARSDADMTRVIDDVVDVLVAKGVIALTDLPEAARTKLTDRSTQRQALGEAKP